MYFVCIFAKFGYMTQLFFGRMEYRVDISTMVMAHAVLVWNFVFCFVV